MSYSSASSIAADFAEGKTTAAATIEATLATIAKLNPKVNAFTAGYRRSAPCGKHAISIRRAPGAERLDRLQGFHSLLRTFSMSRGCRRCRLEDQSGPRARGPRCGFDRAP